MNDGGVILYRATATCSFCGRTDDVGPFEAVRDAIESELPGWIGPADSRIFIRDPAGTPLTICPACAARPLLELRAGLPSRFI